METNGSKNSKHLPDSGKLIIEAVKGITEIVESMHYKIADNIPIPGIKYVAGSKGLPRLIYRFIYAITGRINNNMESLLLNLSKILNEKPSGAGKEALIAVLNGVLGDYLAAKYNSLAIRMQLKENGSPITGNLPNTQSETNQKYLLMIHGSCMNDLQWKMQDHNHGEILASELTYKPLYLHYNTGLHISENGKLLSDFLENIFANNPAAEIHILAHSMGGLVARSACHYAEYEQKRWLGLVKKIIFLGTPHHGAPLEKIGNQIDRILASNQFTEPLSKLGQIRSAGITDMRYGYITDTDWKNSHRFFGKDDTRKPVPLPIDIKCFAIAGISAENPGLTAHEIVGDGMVNLSSALGEHSNRLYNLQFPENQKFISYNTGHIELLYNQTIYAKIKEFLVG